MKECLYSPLNVYVRFDEDLENYDDNDYWRDEITSRQAADYTDEINAAIEKDKIRSNEKSGLMDYFDCDSKMLESSIKDKVISAYPTVKEFNGEVFGVMEMEVKCPLNAEEINELKDYFTGQYSDGWGEGFEQREIKTSDGDMYVEFWSSDKFYIDTASEFQDRTGIELEPNDYTEPGMTQEM